MYFCDRSTEAFGRQTPGYPDNCWIAILISGAEISKKLNTNGIHIWWQFVDIWHNVQIIASWIAKFASWSLVVLYSQYLVPWLILTNTVLNIAKMRRQHRRNYTQNPWTIPNHRCPMSRTSPVFIKRVQGWRQNKGSHREWKFSGE